MCEIILVRHGLSEGNIKHVFGGDDPLSEEGKKQAKETSAYYKSFHPDRVYSSKMKRAIQTAEILFGEPIPEERQLIEFNEMWYGDAEEKIGDDSGTAGSKHHYEDEFLKYMQECHGDDPYERVAKALNKIQELSMEIILNPESFPNRRILIVTSDTLMRCIMKRLSADPDLEHLSSSPRFQNLEHAKLKVTREEDGIRIKVVNDKLCFECGSIMRRINAPETFKINGRQIEIPGVSAFVCDTCGEKQYSHFEAKRIDEYLRTHAGKTSAVS